MRVLKISKAAVGIYAAVYVVISVFGHYRPALVPGGVEYRVWSPFGFEGGAHEIGTLIFLPLALTDRYFVHTTEVAYHMVGDGGCTIYHQSIEPCPNHGVCRPPYWKWDKQHQDWKLVND